MYRSELKYKNYNISYGFSFFEMSCTKPYLSYSRPENNFGMNFFLITSLFLLADILWFPKINKNPQIFVHVYIVCPDNW